MIDWDKPVTLKNHKFESFIRKHLKKTGNIRLYLSLCFKISKGYRTLEKRGI